MPDIVASNRRSLAKVARNAASLLTTDVLNKATTFVVYALVARYADARSFGQLSLGMLLVYTFQVIACGGLPTLITRELATRSRRTGSYFVTGSIVVACTGLLATLAMVLLAAALRYDRDTVVVLSLLALCLIPQALSMIAEAVFRAWEGMHLIAIANVPFNLAKMGAAFFLLRSGFGVAAIAVLLVACRVGILLVEWAILARRLPALRIRVERTLVRRLASRGATFLGIDGLIALWGSLDAVMLSKICGEADVGLYSAAWQLLVPVSLLFQSIVSSLFPMMCQKVKSDPVALRDLIRWLMEFLCLVGFPAAVGLYFFAEPCLLMLYGDPEFASAAGIVRVLLGVLVMQAATSVLGHALWAGLRERVTLRIVAVNVAVNAILGAALIFEFGVIGAAIASLATWAVNVVQHGLALSRLHARISVAEIVWKPLTASVAMAFCFLALSGANVVVASATAVGIYLAVAGMLLAASSGGLRELRSGYFSPLVE